MFAERWTLSVIGMRYNDGVRNIDRDINVVELSYTPSELFFYPIIDFRSIFR